MSNLSLIFSQMSKLYRARSLLYRRQILQENIRWKALDEIYKIYMFLHRSDLNISEKIVKLFRIFRHFFVAKLPIFFKKSLNVAHSLMNFYRNLIRISQITIFSKMLKNIIIFLVF